ncbi:MAG: DMT family transporter [Cognatishimia sp.]|uniref:DMT family transporter n=1 Tax=Cognatishimia sp. TaxID=2211648 RepID=UPI003B8E6CB7
MENLRAMGLMVLAMMCFATADGMIKLLAQSITKGQIMFFMGLAGAIIFGMMCLRVKSPIFTRLFFHPVLLARNIAEVIAALSIFTALSLLPLSTVAAIIQAVPLVITTSAAFLLKEKVGPRRWTAVIIGFIGVLIIVRPDTDGLNIGLILALVGTLALSVRDFASRLAPKQASTPLLSFYAFCALIPAGLGLSFLAEGFAPIDMPTVWTVLLMNVFALGGYFCVTNAMRLGEVSAVSPLRYSRLPFAAIVGYILFTEIPDAPTLLGSALIIGSGLFVMIREAQIKRTSPEV